MFDALKKHNKLGEVVLLGGFGTVCVCLSVFRFLYSGSRSFLFLNWNLFLAFVPWLFSSVLIMRRRFRESRTVTGVLVLFWLAFFPNAPYILTDLLHLGSGSAVPVWFDMLLILSFAWTGLMFGFMSLWDIEKILGKWAGKRTLRFTVAGLLLLAGFGTYLGRYLRWNSWDIIREPSRIVQDIGDRFLNPGQHPRTWGMTVFMFLFLYMIYLSFQFVKNRSASPETEKHGS